MSSQATSLNAGNPSGFLPSQQPVQQSLAATAVPTSIPTQLQGTQWANGIIQGSVAVSPHRLERRSYQVQSDQLLTNEPDLWHAPKLGTPRSLIAKLFGGLDNEIFEALKELFPKPSQPSEANQTHLNLLYGALDELSNGNFNKKDSYQQVFFLHQLKHELLKKNLGFYENDYIVKTLVPFINKIIPEIVSKLSLEQKCQVVRFANLIAYPTPEDGDEFRSLIQPILYRVAREGTAHKKCWHSVQFTLNYVLECLCDISKNGVTSQFFKPLNDDLNTLNSTILPGSQNYLNYTPQDILIAVENLISLCTQFRDQIYKGIEIQLPKYYHGTLTGNLTSRTIPPTIFQLDIMESEKALYEGVFLSSSFEPNYGPPTLCFNFAVEWRKLKHLLNFFSSGTQTVALYKDEFWIGLKGGIPVKQIDLQNQTAGYNLAAIAVVPSHLNEQAQNVNFTIPVLGLRELRIFIHLLRHFPLLVPATFPNELKKFNPKSPRVTSAASNPPPPPPVAVTKALAPTPKTGSSRRKTGSSKTASPPPVVVASAVAPTPKQTSSRKRKKGKTTTAPTLSSTPAISQAINLAAINPPGTVNPATIFGPPPTQFATSSTTSNTTTTTTASSAPKTANTTTHKKAKTKQSTPSKATQKANQSVTVPSVSPIQILYTSSNQTAFNFVKNLCQSDSSQTLLENFRDYFSKLPDLAFKTSCIEDGGIIYSDTEGRMNADKVMTLPLGFSLPQFMLACIDVPSIAREAIIEGLLTCSKPLRKEAADEGTKGELRSTYNQRKSRYESASELFPNIIFPSPLRHLWDDMPQNTTPNGDVVGYNPFVTFNFMNVQTWLFESVIKCRQKLQTKKDSDPAVSKLLENLEYVMEDSLETFLSLLIIDQLSLPLPADYTSNPSDYLDIECNTHSGFRYTVRIDHNTFDKGEAHGRDIRKNPNEPVVLWQMINSLSDQEQFWLIDSLLGKKPLMQAFLKERVEACAEFTREIAHGMSLRYFGSNDTGRMALPVLLPNTPLTSLIAGNDVHTTRENHKKYLLP